MLNLHYPLPSIILFCSLVSVYSNVSAFEYGEPSSFEQAHLEFINRARANPIQEAQRLGISLCEGIPNSCSLTGTPKQPLSFNAQLQTAAHQHSEDMLLNNYFAHINSANQSPFVRFSALHYDFLMASENIAMNGISSTINDVEMAEILHNDLFIDQNYPNRGHRANLLKPELREIGIGLTFGVWHQNSQHFNTAMISTDFGTRKVNHPIIVGVVYDDINHNHFYDVGEGIPNINIANSDGQKTGTASAGGYGIEVDNFHDYTLTFTHPSLGTVQKTIHIDTENRKIDVLINDFPNSSSLTQRTISSLSTQQCLSITQNQLHIPCINVAGTALQVELESIAQSNTESQQFGIRSIAPVNMNNAASCELYDQFAMKAYLRCVKIDQQFFRVELKLKPSATPLLELQTFRNMVLAY